MEPDRVCVRRERAGRILSEGGGFLSALISFMIVAFVMLLNIKGMNPPMDAMKEAEAAPAPAGPPADIVLLSEIRDLLAKE